MACPDRANDYGDAGKRTCAKTKVADGSAAQRRHHRQPMQATGTKRSKERPRIHRLWLATLPLTLAVACAADSTTALQHTEAVPVHVARSGDHWNYQARLEPKFRYGGAQFGGAVALWGPRLVVGAWQHGGTGSGVSEGPAMDGQVASGAAFSFVETAEGWAARSYLKASVPTANTGFGWSVGISENTLAVGAPGVTSPTESPGAVYLFPWLD
jgi:hypothetical protein